MIPAGKCGGRTSFDLAHNLPSSEANTRERGVCWGHPRPRQEASPPAPLIRETSNIALTGHINGLLRFLQELWVPLPESTTFQYFFLPVFSCLILLSYQWLALYAHMMIYWSGVVILPPCMEWWVDREAHLRDVLPACVRKRDALLPLLYHERDSQCLIA